MTFLNCGDNKLTELKIVGFTRLGRLFCRNNWLTTLDVSNCTALTTVECADNQLETLNIIGCTAMTGLWSQNNKLTTLDVSNNTELESLYCFNNQIESLDVSDCIALTTLWCYDNNIKGTNMDTFISSLPNKNGNICIYDSTSKTEGNVCTKSQVAALKGKRWMPYYYNWTRWEEYEGSDDTTGISATEVGNGSEIDANAVAYDLNGNRVEGWQNKKGIYIVNGKKVVVK